MGGSISAWFEPSYTVIRIQILVASLQKTESSVVHINKCHAIRHAPPDPSSPQTDQTHIQMDPSVPMKRGSIPLSTKQEALRLLGVLNNGAQSVPLTNPETAKPYTATTVAKKLKVPRPALYPWMKKRKEIMAIPEKMAKKARSVRQAELQTLEHALHTHMMQTIAILNGVSPFREREIKATALIIRDRLVMELQQRSAVSSVSDAHVYGMTEDINRLQAFKASTGWFYNFSRRYKLGSFKPRGESAFLDASLVQTSRQDLRKQLSVWDIRDICNTDEVGVLYRSFPSRSINPRDQSTGYKRVKDRLTAVLTVFADGTKGPLAIIGPSARPASFPRRFDAERDLGIFYFSQRNSWNTQVLWHKQMEHLNDACTKQHRRVVHVVDNCSAHCTLSDELRNIDTIFLPPNTTSALQPVDAAIGRSFKAAFRRLLVNHVLTYVEKHIEKEDRPVFKLNKAVTIYDGVRLMAAAWDSVPKSVVINGWRKSGILPQFQVEELEDSLSRCRGLVEKSQRPMRGSLFETDRIAAQLRADIAKARGEGYIQSLSRDSEGSTAPEELDDNVAESGVWLQNAEAEVQAEMGDLLEISEFEDVAPQLLQEFLDAETQEPVCRPIHADTSVADSVLCALDTFHSESDILGQQPPVEASVLSGNDLTVSGALETGTRNGSHKRFVDVAKNLQHEARLLIQDNDDSLRDEPAQQLLAILSSKVSELEITIRQSKKQAKITQFLHMQE